MSRERLKCTIAAQCDLEAAISSFQATVARTEGVSSLSDHRLDKARREVHDALGRLLDHRQLAIMDMLRPKAERKAV